MNNVVVPWSEIDWARVLSQVSEGTVVRLADVPRFQPDRGIALVWTGAADTSRTWAIYCLVLTLQPDGSWSVVPSTGEGVMFWGWYGDFGTSVVGGDAEKQAIEEFKGPSVPRLRDCVLRAIRLELGEEEFQGSEAETGVFVYPEWFGDKNKDMAGSFA